MSLREYRLKRDFDRTAEPAPRKPPTHGRRFVIQKHAARRLHYDLRLEMNGVLKSWAVPKGLPLRHGEKHLAVHVEDHPLDYMDFEGTIPAGEYGGGTVMVWDRGDYEPLGRSPSRDLASGKLHFVLHGKKLRGEWYLVRLREENQWLVIRGGEDVEQITKEDRSALSGKTMEQLAGGTRIWSSKNGEVPELPEFAEPMKARLASRPMAGDWVYEIKFDGWRAIARKRGAQVDLVSRSNHDLGKKFPEIRSAVAKLHDSSLILDGEIVALDENGVSSFQLLQAFDLGESRPPIFYYVFDVLHHQGRDTRALPLEERKDLVAEILRKAPPVLRVSAALGSEAGPLLEEARRLGLEGLIGKRAGSAYESGQRSGAWIKLKLHHEQEFVIGGYTEPEGTRPLFGALLVGYYENGRLLCAGKVGTGFTLRTLRAVHTALTPRPKCPFANLPAPRSGRWGQGITAAEMKHCHWVEPERVCQVKFGEWTRDGRLRQPVFLGLRQDKDPAEVRRET